MSKYPIEIPYSFTTDLDIEESKLPLVKIAVLTDNLEEETIDFAPNASVKIYTPTWYIYGVSTLLYVGDIIKYTGLNWGISSSNLWRTKYTYQPFTNYRTLWDSNTPPLEHALDSNYLYWIQQNNKYRLSCPILASNSLPYRILPYSTIRVKRNTGITLAEAEGINLSYEIPSQYTFPNLTLTQPYRFPSVQMTTSKIWLKIGRNKYRLKVYGKFYKWTNKAIRVDEGNYIEGIYNYIPTYKFNGSYYLSYYKLNSYSETIKNIVLYEPEYNPSNVRLLINYINNAGNNEIREYKI